MAADPGRAMQSVIGDFGRVLGRCGPAPYTGCEETAALAMSVMALGHLRIAEERLVVEVVRKSAGLSSVEPGLGGPSWPGLAEKAAEYAEQAAACSVGGTASAPLAGLLDGITGRADEIAQEPGDTGTRKVEYAIFSSSVFVPEGIESRAYFATCLSGLKCRDVMAYAGEFPGGDWLISAIGPV